MRVIVMAVAWIALATPAQAADCQVPPHRAFEWRFPPDYTVVQVFVRLPDIRTEALVCLAQTLRRREARRHFSLAVLDDLEAARHFLPPFEPADILGSAAPRLPPARWPWQFRHVRATYQYDLDRPVFPEAFSLLPMGADDDTQLADMSDSVDLATASPPFCRNQLNGRCLIKMDRFHYPGELLHQASERRSFLVAARLRRDGRMTAVRVASPSPREDRAARAVATAVVQHVQSWRLEAAATEGPVELTVSVESQTPTVVGTRGVLVVLDLPRVSVLVDNVGRPK